ncbi:MAG: GNAT family N-acetyltransferase [Patescibacteria group bacterium]
MSEMFPEPNSLDSLEGVSKQEIIQVRPQAEKEKDTSVAQDSLLARERDKEKIRKVRSSLNPNQNPSDSIVATTDAIRNEEALEKIDKPVVELTPEKWEKYKKLRLRGFETDAAAWGTSVRKEPEQGEAYWREKLGDPSIKMFGIEQNGEIVAMAGLQEKPVGRFLLRRVYTIPEMAGRGFSKTLITKVFDEAKMRGAKNIELDVIEDALPAIGLYKKMGFEEFDGKKGEKGDGQVHTQILMRKNFE